ncbi:hypothetical protein BT96DRAFT_974331 [Gymnopus androsaceus JB14]|uniref:Lysine-specific metallo-endopeptidase domain-containing protein n=1 Tax=Gymnopus androsaceus JB14 TaxID=1447944 RepID=A0A6A4HYI0_9AGAR|nr:hypothetical protein BT96DRAFT_974331 [Gymnopus androsaceus JB14]
MRLSPIAISSFHLLALAVRAAPSAKHTINPLVARLVTIDSSCEGKVEEVLSDAYAIAEVAQNIKSSDFAFTNYFLPGDFIEEFDKTKTFPIDPQHVLDTKMVPNMFKSILAGGRKGRKFTAKCPSLVEYPSCSRSFARTLALAQSVPIMYFCPSFFTSSETKAKISDKTFVDSRLTLKKRWCKAPPHNLRDFITGAHTVLHEMTHLAFIFSYALELTVSDLPETALNAIRGATDINKMRDERDPTKTYGQLGSHPRQARILKDRWTSFLSRANQIRLKQSPSPAAAVTKTANNDADEPRALEGRTEVTEGSLIVQAKNANKGLMVFRDPPPLGATNNAESYAAAATEYRYRWWHA